MYWRESLRCVRRNTLSRCLLTMSHGPRTKCKNTATIRYYRKHSTLVSQCESLDKHQRQNSVHFGAQIARNSSSFDGDEAAGSSSNLAFDRKLKVLQRNGAAIAARKVRMVKTSEETVNYDYFQEEIANRLVDRLDDIVREGGFPLALDVGSGVGHVYRAINAQESFEGVGGVGGVRKLVQLDSSAGMLHRDDDLDDTTHNDSGPPFCGTYKMVTDEEGKLPFPDGTFDLVISSTALHWVNDLPTFLSETKRILKPDGCLIFAVVGGSTLFELRSSLVLAEMERDGGVSPHVGPFVDFADVGSLLTSAGFTLPTVDIDTIKLAYPNATVLMEHLQRMGENNASLNRRSRIGADTFLAAACIYDRAYPLQDDAEDEEDSIEASIQVIYAIGWSPHDSQPKPNERGSAKHKMGDIIVESTKSK